MKFQVQNVYLILIYARLLVYAILTLVYLKGYAYYILLTYERIEIWIFKIISQFSRIWRIEAKYKADKMGKRANP